MRSVAGSALRSEAVPAVVLAAALAAGCGPGVVEGCRAGDGLAPVCGLRNPEDLALAPDGRWLLVSQFASGEGESGSLVALRMEDGVVRPLFPGLGAETDGAKALGAAACPGAPDAVRFAPHGIDLGAVGGVPLLAVVNHGGREAVELFEVAAGTEGPTLGWRGCVPFPDDVFANDVAFLPPSAGRPEGSLVATWMLPRDGDGPTAGALLGVLLGRDTGAVLAWEPGGAWTRVPGSEESAPNGIAVSADGQTLFVASWARSVLVRIARDGSRRDEVALPHHPDNLTWARDGRLLVAGQHGSVLAAFACGRVETGTCALPFSVLAVDPSTLALEEILDHDASVTGAASVALEAGGALWIGSYRGDRVAVMAREP